MCIAPLLSGWSGDLSVSVGASGPVQASIPVQASVPARTAVSAACDDAMSKAASVQDEDNDAELDVTATACKSDAEWVAALEAHPGAGTLTSYTDDDANFFLQGMCLDPSNKASRAPVCVDAIKRHLLDG